MTCTYAITAYFSQS